jgi:hypothetical protein
MYTMSMDTQVQGNDGNAGKNIYDNKIISYKIYTQIMSKHVNHPAKSILSHHMSEQMFHTRTVQKEHNICTSLDVTYQSHTCQHNGTAHTLGS